MSAEDALRASEDTERERAEAALRNREARYRSLFERNLAGVYRSTLDGWMLECNDALARMFGYTAREEILGGAAVRLHEAGPGADEFVERLKKEGQLFAYEARGRRKDGTTIHFLENVRLLEGAIVEGTAIDVTGHRAGEGRLRQVQRMEAIGRLAGGVAHDFDSLLRAILDHGEMALKRLGGDDPARVELERILEAAQAGTALTQQLLAFCGKQVLQPRALELNVVVAKMDQMLRPLIGEDIELKTVLDPSLGPVEADADQILQAVVNLVVNAREAMPRGGTLTIETGNAVLEAPFAGCRPIPRPGPYVMLAVTDTGVGMDDSTRAQAFEPYFTTKELGKGAGLGLSTVYGIVAQSGGCVRLRSELGAGTTLGVYLPRIDKRPVALVADTSPPLEAGRETVLLVEDEAPLRDLLREALEGNGYVVLVARDGAEAIQIAAGHTGPIQMMVTDLIMPGMTGYTASETITRTRPQMKVLYISGYGDEAISRALGGGAAFLGKPFTCEAMLRRVREVLSAPPAPLLRPKGRGSEPDAS